MSIYDLIFSDLDDDYLMHYGTPRHSGRYPWGSGEDPYQSEEHPFNFRKELERMRKEGMSDDEIRKSMNMTTTEFRDLVTITKAREKKENYERAISLLDKGYSKTEAAKIMDIPVSTFNDLIKAEVKRRETVLEKTCDFLRSSLEEGVYLDVGAGANLDISAENNLNAHVSNEKLRAAITVLKNEGYAYYNDLQVKQEGGKNKTTLKVLAPPGTTKKDIYDNLDNIKGFITLKDVDGANKSVLESHYINPVSIDSKRIMFRYAEEGGSDMDGVIQLRRNSPEFSLGSKAYAQVRIAVDDKYYMKGMAIYADNMPPGVDVIFNTNKSSGAPIEKVLKPMKTDSQTGEIDKFNPFGASIKKDKETGTVAVKKYIGDDGKEHVSPVMIVNEEGDWDKWSRTLASQMLSKQPLKLIKSQLKLTYADKVSDYDDIMHIQNPTVRKKYLADFAEACDAAAVDLKADALPGQKQHVILPVNSLKDNEIYAPNYQDGETVVLIRYPHAGTFEIPQLVVNNKNKEARNIMGNSTDAVGININVAHKLSGADFDGDSVTVIPANSSRTDVRIITKPSLPGLVDFDTNIYAYAPDEKHTPMSSSTKGREMGKITNLIMDMTLKGAPDSELERAVKHSMVVIDAEKHDLNYKKSEIDNGIAELKRKWQSSEDGSGGVATLITRAKNPMYVDKTEPYYISKSNVDSEGRKILKKAKPYGYDENGNPKYNKEKVPRMSQTDDAFTLSSGDPKENAYANYANQMKALANKARKEWLATPSLKVVESSKKEYSKEIATLNEKLKAAYSNSSRERQATIIANAMMKERLANRPDLKKDTSENKSEIKRMRRQCTETARIITGSKSQPIYITDREWEAINSGAIADSTVQKILLKAQKDRLNALVYPKVTKDLSSAKIAKIKALDNSKYTTAEIAEIMGVSVSTVLKYTKASNSVENSNSDSDSGKEA